jgi:uncharacterized cupin superfamily protein
MLEERGGWFVVNVKDARWTKSPAFGLRCSFESPDELFPQVGINLFVLEPGKPNGRYHREGDQEDLLVLSGRCRLIVNDQERLLGPWDFVHFPAGVTHIVVGDGYGPCAILFIGHRDDPAREQLYYPASELARRYGAETPEPTADPDVAYSDVPRRKSIEAPDWPPRV